MIHLINILNSTFSSDNNNWHQHLTVFNNIIDNPWSPEFGCGFFLTLGVLAVIIYIIVSEPEIEMGQEISKTGPLLFTIIVSIVSVILMCFGYSVPCSRLADRTDNGDGTMYVVEHSMSGNSKIVGNVKKPTVTYGTVINSDKGSHFIGLVGKGGHRVTHFDISVKLSDGRVFNERLNGVAAEYKAKIGVKWELHERYYPYYMKELKYSK